MSDGVLPEPGGGGGGLLECDCGSGGGPPNTDGRIFGGGGGGGGLLVGTPSTGGTSVVLAGLRLGLKTEGRPTGLAADPSGDMAGRGGGAPGDSGMSDDEDDCVRSGGGADEPEEEAAPEGGRLRRGSFVRTITAGFGLRGWNERGERE